ncbi:MAG: enoyl-CoA hydratase [Candidatus Azotimanducaceae bacterium]|jgi:enoyl-CoA hydratase
MKLETTKMLAEVKEGIGWVTFNQPEKRNAISLEMWRGLAVILESFAHDQNVRVVVMRGAGDKAFVSGADISEFDTNRSNAAQKEAYSEVAAEANRWLARLDKPLLALIQGYCIGGGLATALAADVRFATTDATFGIPAAKLGLGYEYQGLKRLVDIVGPSRAKDIMFSARFMSADEALQMGLINRVCSREQINEDIKTYAQTVAGNAPLTVKAAKAAINDALREPGKQDRAGVDEMIDACFDSEDYAEGRAAFAAKRKPVFRGR